MAEPVVNPYTRVIFELPEGRPNAYIEPIEGDVDIPSHLLRKDLPIGNWDEPTVVRHFVGLSQKNFSVDTNFYPLGSCTMKYNPKVNEDIARRPEVVSRHPHLISEGIEELIQDLLRVVYELEQMLISLTGMARFTFQPMAGANGEFCGISLVSAYHRKRNDRRRFIIVPDSAHGTNPASATLGGYEVINVKTTETGYLTLDAIRPYLNRDCAGLMLTSPNTLGLFNPEIDKISQALHDVGALLYYDGANFNALMGWVKPADLGFDIVHLNLHKSFSTPHGSGGPGAGPVGVVDELVEFLPVPLVEKAEDGRFYLNWDLPSSIGKISPFLGNFAVLVRAYVYLLSLGLEGVREATLMAVANANYLREKIKNLLHIPYDIVCMHEFVASVEELKQEQGITAMDIAKALIDKGIHPPTVYFPLIVKEAMMIEPTETESKFTLDYFIDALKDIIRLSKDDLKMAPRNTGVSRPDEVKAVKDMDVCYCKRGR